MKPHIATKAYNIYAKALMDMLNTVRYYLIYINEGRM